jgi:hypothetical protein
MEPILTAKSFMHRYQQRDTSTTDSQSRQHIILIPHINPNWQVLLTTASSSKSNTKWQGISFVGKDKNGNILFVGCRSTRLQHPILAQATAIQEGILQANNLGFTKIIITESKSLQQMWTGHQQQSWQLTPIFADINNLIQLQGIQLQIFKVPAALLLGTKAMANSASQYFVNVTSVAPNSIL